MTPSKRRPATPASQGPTRTAPDVPAVADPPPVPPPPTPASDVLTAPPDAPVADEVVAVPAEVVAVPVPAVALPDEVVAVSDEVVAVPVLPAETNDSTQEASRADASGDSAPPTETGRVDPEDRATKQSPRRPLALYPLPVWPD